MKGVCPPLAAHTAVDGCLFSLSFFKNGNNVMEKSENLSRGSEISYVEILWAMRFILRVVLCRLDSTVAQCG